MKIPLWEPPLKEYDRLSQGEKTRLFKERFAEYIGAKFAVACSSGTAALFMALKACGVGVGDEVIVPDFTFVATANAVRLTGAGVVLQDVRKEDLLIQPIPPIMVTERTKAVIPVHLNGRLVDVKKFRVSPVQKKVIIEDATQSLGCKGVGEGHMACFSFSPTKSIYTGQGGIVTTNDYWAYRGLLMLRDQGRVDKGPLALSVGEGYNFKFTDLQAGIALKYLSELDTILEAKKRVYKLYQEQLEGLGAIKFIGTDLEVTVPWLVDIMVVDYITRERLIVHLEKKGVETRRFYTPIHLHPSYSQHGFPNAEYISQRGLYLPSSIHLKQEEITYVCSKVKEFFE